MISISGNHFLSTHRKVVEIRENGCGNRLRESNELRENMETVIEA